MLMSVKLIFDQFLIVLCLKYVIRMLLLPLHNQIRQQWQFIKKKNDFRYCCAYYNSQIWPKFRRSKSQPSRSNEKSRDLSKAVGKGARIQISLFALRTIAIKKTSSSCQNRPPQKSLIFISHSPPILNLFPWIIDYNLNILYRQSMSYVYSFYNCFNPYPQALYPLYTQNSLQNTLQPLYFSNSHSDLTEIKTAEKFQPILVSAHSTCQTLSPSQAKPKEKRQIKQIKKECSRNKDQSFGWRNQNKDRNMISSILKGYVHYVLQGRGMVKFIEELSKKRQMENGVSKFYEFMTQNFPSRKSYIGLRYMQEILTSRPAEDHMTFILSLTLRLYLRQTYPLFVVQGCRMKKKSRLALLKKARTIASLIFAS